MTDFYDIVARMADELDHYDRMLMDDLRVTNALAAEARAALAELQPAADGEVGELVARLRDHHTIPLLQERDRAAELLERLADGPAVPAGEVAETVATTEGRVRARRILGLGWEPGDGTEDGAQLVDGDWWFPALGCDSLQETLLRVRHLLSVESSLVEPEDISYEFIVSDPDYCTQAEGVSPSLQQAIDEGRHYLAQYNQDGPHTLEVRRIETLFTSTAHALPLPSGEGE